MSKRHALDDLWRNPPAAAPDSPAAAAMAPPQPTHQRRGRPPKAAACPRVVTAEQLKQLITPQPELAAAFGVTTEGELVFLAGAHQVLPMRAAERRAMRKLILQLARG